MAKLFQFFILCVFQTYSFSLNMSIVYAFHLCPPEQGLSLLKLKETFHIDTYKERCRKQIAMGYYVRLSSYCGSHNIPIMEPKIYSWNRSTDCCFWEGVTCDEFTGNVIELDLSGNRLIGVIDSNSSIFQLSDLKKLNLAYNLFDGSEISPIFCRLTHLTHLNLTESGWQGKVPFEISQLQDLVSLDLSRNFELILEPYVFKVILQNLTRVRVLSLGSVRIISSLPNNLSSSLMVIDLSHTNLQGTFLNQLFHLPNLKQLSLGANIFDDFGSLASTKWNTTSRLQKLELDYIEFPKTLLDTIGNLKHLTYLDLSSCHLNGTLPQSFGNLTQLDHLDLSSNKFSQIPPEILGLEHLTYLDIGWNHLDTSILPSASKNLKKLKFLNLEGNKLATPSVSSFLRNLTQIEAIDLHDNSLYEIPLELFELSLLRLMDLSDNNLQGPIPKSFSNLVNLEYLSLASNNLEGPIPKSFSNLVSLEYLFLGSNNLEGPIPKSFANLVNLEYLSLESNNLQGPIPKSFSNLVNLESLILASNNLSGRIEIDAISNFLNLTTFDISSNNFSGTVDIKFLRRFKWMDLLDLSSNSLTVTNENNTTLPVVSIDSLFLASCNIRDLDVLRSIVVRSMVDLHNNNIHGEIPEWVLSSWSNVIFIDLSTNYITHIGSMTLLQSLETLDLRSNLLQGELPALPQSIRNLFLSNNQFHGEIKPSICNLTDLNILDLSNNRFNGAFPHCFGMMPLYILDLHTNNLKGTIPNTFQMKSLLSLSLRGNHLEGEVPRSLVNCSGLQVIDLSENYLSDIFPTWLRDLPYLRILSLIYNKFYGPISPHHASPHGFSQLQIFDISYNQLSGSLPASLFQTFRQMMNKDGRKVSDDDGYVGNEIRIFMHLGGYHDSLAMVLNGHMMQLEKIFSDMLMIDLSSNLFEGEIPNSIGGLFLIQRLNLSYNKFTGQIPPQLGNLSQLLSLDLSSNELHGNIPDQLVALGFLSVMNLSYNHLTEKIPYGPQLQTFPNDSYIGNDGLCGYPLSRNCAYDDSSKTKPPDDGISGKDDHEFFDGFTWQSVLVGYGVGVCVGMVLGSLMLHTEKPKWLIRIVKEEANKVIYKYKSRNGINQIWFKRS